MSGKIWTYGRFAVGSIARLDVSLRIAMNEILPEWNQERQRKPNQYCRQPGCVEQESGSPFGHGAAWIKTTCTCTANRGGDQGQNACTLCGPLLAREAEHHAQHNPDNDRESSNRSDKSR